MHERFYLNPLPKTEALLEGPEFHHLAHVLRIRTGETIELVDGNGSLASATVASLERHNARLNIRQIERFPKPPRSLSLGIPLMRMSKLEWIVEKGTELGADAFFLFPADHSDKTDLTPHQRERLEHLAVSALKQCRRLYLPEIALRPSLAALLDTPAICLFGDLAARLGDLPDRQPPLLFLSGPEQGFSERETALLREKAFGLRLSANVLRAETAPLAALSILLFIN